MKETYFKEHIFPYNSEIQTWIQGESFRVEYQIKIDWMICKLSDQFIIKTIETTYPDLTIQRGDYLTESEISQVIAADAFSSSINIVGSFSHLKYSSERSALKAICSPRNKKSESNEYRYQQKSAGFVPNGHPYLYFGGTMNIETSSCFEGKMDLITGTCESNEMHCRIN